MQTETGGRGAVVAQPAIKNKPEISTADFPAISGLFRKPLYNKGRPISGLFPAISGLFTRRI
jgi:hypothetical protein